MEKIWLKSYPPGMQTEIDTSQYRSLVQLLEESFHKFADRNAYVCMDKFLTYAEVDACSKVVAKFSRMMMASLPESFSWCSSSRGVYSGLMLTTV